MKVLLYLLCTATLILGSCGKDDSEANPPQPETEIESPDDDGDFVPNSQIVSYDNSVSIVFSENGATVTNQFEGAGVEIENTDGHVVIRSTTDKELNYILSGVITNGSVKIYGVKKFGLILNGVGITNPKGAAINNQCGKKIVVTIVEKTNNRLIDGSVYEYIEGEDMKATFFSEGNMEISGSGSLEIRGKNKHGSCIDGSLLISDGIINIKEAASDGIHANDEITLAGGKLTVNSSGDGIESESTTKPITITAGTLTIATTGEKTDAIKTKNSVSVNTTGSITITCTGKGGDGISAVQSIDIAAGTIQITCSGNGEAFTNTEGLKDSYNATCVTADGNLSIADGTVNLTNSGSGGKGISVVGTITLGTTTTNPIIDITTTGAKFAVSTTSTGGGGPQGGGSSTDYCLPKAVKADGAILIENGNISVNSADDGIKSEVSITINGGRVEVKKSYEGLESKLITVNGGYVDVTATDDAINTTAGTVSGGTESNDGSVLTINGGTVIATSTAGDALDSNGNILMTGGVMIANGPSTGVEESVDTNGSFTMNGGLCITCGSNSNMTKAMSTASVQPNFYMTVSSGISSSTFVNVAVGGADVLTFKPKNTAYKFLLSNTGMAKGAAYSISTGGSYTGGTSVGGVYSGGAYSGGTVKKSGTMSASSTVNTVSF